MVDAHTIQFFITIDRILGTNRHAGRFLAVLAAHGHIKSLIVPFYDVNARQRRIADTVMLDGTDQLT
jgi:hypothetical protein